MDTLSHALWATVAGKGANLKVQKKIKLRWMAFWGVMPDLFSFTPVIVWILWQMFYHGVNLGEVPRPETLPPEQRNSLFIFRLTQTLYHISHSFVIFLALFFLISFLYQYRLRNGKKASTLLPRQSFRFTPCWELTGWFIHIASDIPTHTRDFYPVLFLWPLSDWCFDGFTWGTAAFISFNYSFLLLFFILFWLMGLKKPLSNI